MSWVNAVKINNMCTSWPIIFRHHNILGFFLYSKCSFDTTFGTLQYENKSKHLEEVPFQFWLPGDKNILQWFATVESQKTVLWYVGLMIHIFLKIIHKVTVCTFCIIHVIRFKIMLQGASVASWRSSVYFCTRYVMMMQHNWIDCAVF